MNFTRMLGSLVIKKHVVCRRSRPSSSLVGGRVWSRPGLGARRAAAHAAPVPASTTGRLFGLKLLPPSRAASRVLSELEPGGGTELGRRFRWRREVAAFGGTLAECPCERLERLPRCKWGFSSVVRRLGNVSGSMSVAPTSSPHDRRFSGTRSLSCTVCARRTPTWTRTRMKQVPI